MFVGFTEGVKGFRLWQPTERKCINSRDVIFREEEMFMLQTTQNIDSAKESTTFKVELPILTTTQNTDEVIPQEEEEEYVEVQDEISQQAEDLFDYSLAHDRKRRQIVPPKRFDDANIVAATSSVAHSFNDHEPSSFIEAINSPNAREWIDAMNEEMTSLMINETWTIVSLSKGEKAISSKWIYIFKDGVPGVQEPRFKARFVAK